MDNIFSKNKKILINTTTNLAVYGIMTAMAKFW